MPNVFWAYSQLIPCLSHAYFQRMGYISLTFPNLYQFVAAVQRWGLLCCNISQDLLQLAVEYAIHRRRRPRSCEIWVKPWIGRRRQFGLYDQLMVELRNEDERAFRNFLRMPPEMYELLDNILLVTETSGAFPRGIGETDTASEVSPPVSSEGPALLRGRRRKDDIWIRIGSSRSRSRCRCWSGCRPRWRRKRNISWLDFLGTAFWHLDNFKSTSKMTKLASCHLLYTTPCCVCSSYVRLMFHIRFSYVRGTLIYVTHTLVYVQLKYISHHIHSHALTYAMCMLLICWHYARLMLL